MKAIVFIPEYYDFFYGKEIGQIAEGFLENNVDVEIYCFKNHGKIIRNYKVKEISDSNSLDINFWKNRDADFFLIYSYFSLKYSDLVESVNKSGKPVLLKLDSDGHLGFPHKPTYLRGFSNLSDFKDFLIYIGRQWQWLWPRKKMHLKKISQIENSFKTIIETPEALKNLSEVLDYWGKEKLKEKLVFIPNSINSIFISEPLSQKKEKIIISVGRWDSREKNKKGLLRAIINFSKNNEDYRFCIIGRGSNYFLKKLKNHKLIEKVDIFPEISQKELISKLSKTQIFLLPSFWESFCLAAAEALTQGASLAGAPIEPVKYFINNDNFGSMAKNWSGKELANALKIEADKWQSGKYDFQKKAEFFRNEFERKKIAQKIIDLVKKI